MYILHLNAGTQKTQNLLQYLSAKLGRLTTEWPETIGLTEVLSANINADDWGWFLDDIQNANITRLGESQYRIALPQMAETTPQVIATLLSTNNRLGHSHLKFACYSTQAGRIIPVDAKQDPVPFANDNPDIGTGHDDLTVTIP